MRVPPTGSNGNESLKRDTSKPRELAELVKDGPLHSVLVSSLPCVSIVASNERKSYCLLLVRATG